MQPCLPRIAEGTHAICQKQGGVCSLRSYRLSEDGAAAVPDRPGALATTCPERFKEGLTVFQWVGEVILGHKEPIRVGEVGFLERPLASGRAADVGRIDMVLAHPNLTPLSWCALEMQAVYFSGDTMSSEFARIAAHASDSLPFPVGRRRPDYRSSGPKRLMPQLQIKVPTLRRWGKKMAVVVDEIFFGELGQMEDAGHLSNADIAWFVMRYQEQAGRTTIEPAFVRYTTLERAVEGLTAGVPVTQAEFEDRIHKKLVTELGANG